MIDILYTGHDALPELLLGCHPDVTQYRAGKLGEEALDEIEPGATDEREGELEAAGRSSGEPASGLLRYMSGMIVENQLNRGAGRIGGIEAEPVVRSRLGLRVLEVGVGTGIEFLWWSLLGVDVPGIDPFQHCIDATVERLAVLQRAIGRTLSCSLQVEQITEFEDELAST
jgi:hypothetical protein